MTTNRRLLAALLQALLPIAAAGAIFAGGASTMEYSPLYDIGASSEVEDQIAADTLSTKPRNEWGTQDLVDAGYEGCERVRTHPRADAYYTSHIVRLPAEEGFRWVRMDRDEVARRIENYGGTPSTSDDVHIVGNCI